MLPPHAAAGLCFQVLREMSTSWNIAKRIGRNLEKVYVQRYGVDHLPLPAQDSGPTAESRQTDLDGSWETGLPPLHAFDEVFDANNTFFEYPLSLHLENSFTPLHNPNLNQFHEPSSDVTDPNPLQNFLTSDELFANNLGFAFSPDCLPSDYNMFDTLNQTYLEETW